MKTNTFELYLHIPFCVRKCGYCDFLSFPAGKDVQACYLEALKTEIRTIAARQHPAGQAGGIISSIFIGGGTPSVLTGNQIAELMDTVRGSFSVLPDAEITIEANPGTLDPDKLYRFRAAGINRISIGCQSMHDRELARMGRIHSHADFLQGFAWARQAGFDNINIDLIAALPGQTLADWRETLHSAAALGPEHISAYNLILEEGTPFYEKRAVLNLPDEETERAMYEETASILAGYGFRQYELSNYAKPGRECRHNLGYWTGVPYLGLGLGAASYWPAESANMLPLSAVQIPEEAGGESPWMIRFSRTSALREYLDRTREHADVTAEDTVEILRKSDCMAEFMILGLRMTEGVSKAEFCRRFETEPEQVYGTVFRKYQAAGLLQCEEDRIFLTGRGRSLANVVMMEFL